MQFQRDQSDSLTQCALSTYQSSCSTWKVEHRRCPLDPERHSPSRSTKNKSQSNKSRATHILPARKRSYSSWNRPLWCCFAAQSSPWSWGSAIRWSRWTMHPVSLDLRTWSLERRRSFPIVKRSHTVAPGHLGNLLFRIRILWVRAPLFCLSRILWCLGTGTRGRVMPLSDNSGLCSFERCLRAPKDYPDGLSPSIH